MKTESCLAVLTSEAGGSYDNQRPNFTIAEFCAFQVSDSSEPCSSCDTDPPRKPAPIHIGARKFCLWCALEIARELLVRQ